MLGGTLLGVRFSKRLELTLVRRMDTLCTRCLTTSASSPPKCLARALPIIFTWATDSASQCLEREWLKNYARPSTSLPMLGHLPLVCLHQSMARGDCSLLHHSNLEGVDDCYVESSVLSPSPGRNVQVRWSSICAWQQSPVLSRWCQACLGACVEEGISNSVVSEDPFPSPTTRYRVISSRVRLVGTSHTLTSCREHINSKPVFHRHCKLRGAQVQAQSGGGDCIYTSSA